MKLRCTRGVIHTINFGSEYKLRTREACKSELQYQCGQLIKDRFPVEEILEEVYIPFQGFYLDFFLPRLKIVFEIQGRQHYEYNKFFHKNKLNFNESKKRDFMKEEWCKINNITLYTVDSVEQLKEVLA